MLLVRYLMVKIQIFLMQQLFIVSSGKTSLPVKNSHLLKFPNDKADILAECV